MYCVIIFKNNCDHVLTVGHLKDLYGIHAHLYLALMAKNVNHIRKLRDMALKKAFDRKCRIQCAQWPV